MYTGACFRWNQPLSKLHCFFCLMCALQSVHISFFCGCLSRTIAHLRNLFLLSTPVAQMLLTPRWVSRRKHVTWLFITVGGTHPINRRTTFSPYLHLVEEATYFPFFTPWYGSNYMPLYRYGYGYWTIQPMPLQEPKFYISLDSACFLFVGHCYDLLKR